MPSVRRFHRLTQQRHRARLLRATALRWQQRSIFVLGGVTVGAVAVGFAMLADRAQRSFLQVLGFGQYWALALTPLGFVICVFAAQRWFRNSQGSGIPQAIAAHRIADPQVRSQLVSLRAAIGKIGLTLFGLLCGASTGREGPTVQIGASIMFAAGRLSPRKQSGLIIAGAAAGIAAAFNTPIAGIMFGIEELTRTFERRTSGLVLTTVVAAGFISLALVGNYTYFGATAEALHGASNFAAIPICGVVGGIAGGIFSRIIIAFASRTSNVLRGFPQRQPVFFAALCGLAVALCGIAAGGATYGTGYIQVENALGGGHPLGTSFVFLKFLATLFSSLSGIPGGIFSPSLAIGAGLGSDIAQLFSSIDVGAVMLLGMVAYLAGVVQAPITAFVIVNELTDNRAMLMPVMLTALIAYGASRLVCPEGIYHALARNFIEARAKPPA
jgi:H+/Cl- antiporter ClcA